MFHTRIKRADVLASVSVLLAALILFLFPSFFATAGNWLEVSTPDGCAGYSLSQNGEYSVTSRGITLQIVIENGEVYVAHSTCPDGICMASRPISQNGESILCAPAGVALIVKGGGEDVDFVAG